jgi:hypothetical protein
MGSKTHNFILISIPLKMFHKNSHTKVYKQNNLSKMSNSEIVHISITFLLITFFVWNYY